MSGIFTSCSYFGDYWTKHDFEIKNTSSQTVSFTIDKYGDALHTLKPSESTELQLYDHPHFTFEGNPRIEYKSGVSSASIYDMQSFTFEISNLCFYPVILSEENNLMTDTYGKTVTIPAATVSGSKAEASKLSVTVYKTDSPIFHAYYLDDNSEEIDATDFITYKLTD